jgi:branched-chain amino acid transport system permease protein
LWTKVALGTFSAFIAGVGGGLLAMYALAAIPTSYDTFVGLTWLAVLVTTGIRTSTAALVAGLIFSFVPELFLTYLPASWGEVPPALFGLGAVLVARNPEGTIAIHARQLERLFRRRQPVPDVEALPKSAPRSSEDLMGEITEPMAR